MNSKFFLKSPPKASESEPDPAPVLYLELSGFSGSEGSHKDAVHRIATEADAAQYPDAFAAFKKEQDDAAAKKAFDALSPKDQLIARKAEADAKFEAEMKAISDAEAKTAKKDDAKP